LYDILGSFKIENNSEKLKGFKTTSSSLFISIDSIILLLILSNEWVVVNIIFYMVIYHESFLQLQSLKCQEDEYLV